MSFIPCPKLLLIFEKILSLISVYVSWYFYWYFYLFFTLLRKLTSVGNKLGRWVSERVKWANLHSAKTLIHWAKNQDLAHQKFNETFNSHKSCWHSPRARYPFQRGQVGDSVSTLYMATEFFTGNVTPNAVARGFTKPAKFNLHTGSNWICRCYSIFQQALVVSFPYKFSRAICLVWSDPSSGLINT